MRRVSLSYLIISFSLICCLFVTRNALCKSQPAKGLYLGAGRNLGAGTFWSGLIDDIRIYNRAVSP
jgi:hypothetical protein